MPRSSAPLRAVLARLPLLVGVLAVVGIAALTVPPIGPSAPVTASSTSAAPTPVDAFARTDPARSVEAIVQLRAGTPASAGRALIARQRVQGHRLHVPAAHLLHPVHPDQ